MEEFQQSDDIVMEEIVTVTPTKSILKKTSRGPGSETTIESDTRPLKSKSSKTSFSEKVDLVSTGIDAIDASDQDPTASIQSKVTLSEDCEVTPDPDIRPSPEESVVSRQMEEDSHPANCMTFHNVSYEVSGLKRFKWVTKTILSSVSGIMFPGINAIMGPTGGGKTTLLDILAGRKGRSGISQKIRGSVLLNGERRPPNFKLLTGYVVQEDILEGILTVRENLEFSAALRLPRQVTRKERKERVETIIKQLGLTSCANTVTGTEFIRGVSGGEKKRTVIGMELVIDPLVLFLDEPTTGLDAHTAVSVMQTLQDWCRDGDRLVIMSIHQPRYSIFKLFDSLTLLSLGSTVYHGKAQHAIEYFGNLGFGLEDRENPADFVLDVINDSQSAISTHRRTIRKVKPEKKIDLIAKYRDSDESMYVEKQTADGNIATKSGRPRRWFRYLKYHFKLIPYYIYSFFWQALVLGVRSTASNWRNPSTMLFQVIVMAIVAVIIGVVYLQLGTETFTNINNYVGDRIGALFLISLAQEFGVLSGFDLFISQRALFIHENGGGFYRVFPYFISKIITDVIPLRLIPLFLFSVIVYFMIGFVAAADKFFIFLLILSLGAITLSSFAFAISASIKNRSIAIVLFSLINIASILFGGFVVSSDSLPAELAWLQYLSVYGYVNQALAVNEILGVFYNEQPINGTCELILGCVNGTATLELRDFPTSTDFIWISVGGLVGITLALWCLTYVLLRCAKKHK